MAQNSNKTKNTNYKIQTCFGFVFCALFVLWFLCFVLFPNDARAGLVIKGPSYLGLNAGLVGYWSFDGKDMAGFPNGAAIPATVYDRSGQGNNGKYYNATGTPAAIGKLGQALQFDGVDDYVSVTDSSSLAPDYITVSMWINVRDADNVNFPVPLEKLPVNENYLFVIGADNRPIWRLDIAGDSTNQDAKDTSNTITIGSWEHWVGTYDGITMRFYRNGLQTATKSITGTMAKVAGNFVYGGQPGNPNAFNGSIDDVRIYNRALSPDEIKRLYNIGGTMHVNTSNTGKNSSLTQGLAGWWTFDGPDTFATTSTGFVDKSGNNNIARLVSGKLGIGKIGQGVDFTDAVSTAQVAVGDASAFVFDSTMSVTVSVWVKPNSLTASKDFVDQGNPGNTSGNGFALTSLYFNIIGLTHFHTPQQT